MSNTEYLGWRAYFEIYPLALEQRDIHHAQLLAAIYNTSGMVKRLVNASMFLPDYLQEEKPVVIVEKSLEQQRAEWSDFKERYRAAQAMAQGQME